MTNHMKAAIRYSFLFFLSINILQSKPFESTYQPLPAEKILITNANIYDGDGNEFKNTDVLVQDGKIIAIGEDFKSMILCANILTELSIKRIIGRVMGENERLILKKLGISEILSPEDEIGKNITNSLLNPNIVFSLELPDNFLIAEIKSPEKLWGEKLGEIKLREDFGLNLITILRGTKDSNNEIKHNIFGIPSADTKINKDDILILFGSSTDIKKFVEINS